MAELIYNEEQDRFYCPDCRCGCHNAPGRKIPHSSRCDLRGLQPKFAAPEKVGLDSAAAIRRAAKSGEVYRHYTGDELQEAVDLGLVSVSDAMNQDF